MTLRFILLVVIGLMPMCARAQMLVDRIDVAGQFTFAGSTQDGITRASGPGATAFVQLRPIGRMNVAVAAGLQRLTIDQNDAADRWNWGYWELQWKPESEAMLADPNYSAEQIPVQDALLVSGSLLPGIRLGSDAFGVQLSAGPSITFYARRLYLDEHWSRYYPDEDESFEMHFRTYAEDKTAFEVGADARLSAHRRVAGMLNLTGAVHYRRLFSGSPSDLPLNDFIALQLGLAFTY